MNWVQADTYCKEHHNDLAIVRNLEENQQIQGLNISGSLWIGLHRDAWKWSDGTRAHFTNWRKGEPNGAEDCCASIDFADSGVWQDRDCGERLVFICYWGKPWSSLQVHFVDVVAPLPKWVQFYCKLQMLDFIFSSAE